MPPEERALELPAKSTFPRAAGTASTREHGRRPRLRPGVIWTLVWLAMGGAAVYFLAPELGSLQESLRSLEAAQPWWPIAGAGLVALRYGMAALSLHAAASRPLALGPTLLVQMASAFVGRFTPESIGWLVMNQRYLERSGLERASALGAIALRVLVGGIARLLLMALVAAMVGTTGAIQLAAQIELGSAWPYILAVALGCGLIALALRLAFRSAAARIQTSIESALRDLRCVLGQPLRAATLFGTSAGVTVTYPLVLVVCLMALGVEASWLEVFAVYLGGTAVASVSPIPGNLGALEVALSAGLVVVGVPPASAAASVLVYRLLTFWLPILPGFLALRYLQREGHL